jgi:hypothetical protein
VDSKPSATEGEAVGGGGGLNEKVIAKKCGGWSVPKVVAIAGRLRDLGYARITGARIEPVWPDKAVAP